MSQRPSAIDRFTAELDGIREQGLFKSERIITSPQSAEIELADGHRVLNFCANNYLGLADHPEVIQAAKDALDSHGFGMASVRFICGTQDLHKQLEAKIADFFGQQDAILYAACFDANGGLFEPLLGPDDAVISDALNHASIIDGVRLCKARRYRYGNCDMADLEQQLQQARADGARTIDPDHQRRRVEEVLKHIKHRGAWKRRSGRTSWPSSRASPPRCWSTI